MVFLLFDWERLNQKILRYLSQNTDDSNLIHICFIKYYGQLCMSRPIMNAQKQPSRSVLRKTCSKFTGKLIEFALRRECSRVNLLYIFIAPLSMNTFVGLLLSVHWRSLECTHVGWDKLKWLGKLFSLWSIQE